MREPDSALEDIYDDVRYCRKCHEIHDLAMPCPPPATESELDADEDAGWDALADEKIDPLKVD